MVYSCIIYIRSTGHTAALNTAHYSTFLFFEVRSWNLVWRIFLRNETIWYIYICIMYIWPAGRQVALSHPLQIFSFFISWAMFMKFSTRNIYMQWNPMIYTCIISMAHGPHTGPQNLHFSGFLFFELCSGNLVERIFIWNGTVWYSYVLYIIIYVAPGPCNGTQHPTFFRFLFFSDFGYIHGILAWRIFIWNGTMWFIWSMQRPWVS